MEWGGWVAVISNLGGGGLVAAIRWVRTWGHTFALSFAFASAFAFSFSVSLAASLAATRALSLAKATATQTKHKVQSGLLLDIVVGESVAVFQLSAGENKALLIRRNAFPVLDLIFHVLNRVIELNTKRDGLAAGHLHKDLHAAVIGRRVRTDKEG